MPATTRCASHPARLSAGPCPVCGRPRCGADASAFADAGCPTCRRESTALVARGLSAPSRLERLVRAALAASLVGFIAGVIGSQYVDTTAFSLIVPALGGVATGAAALRAAGSSGRGRTGTLVRLIGAGYAVLGAAYAFRLVVGDGLDPFGAAGEVLPPYVLAAAAAWLWTAPPRARRPGRRRGPRRGQRAADR